MDDHVVDDAYMIIQRKKLSIFINVKSDMLVNELKNMVGCIIKTSPENLQLYYKDEILNGYKTLSDSLCSSWCLDPVPIGLALKMNDEEFEPLDIVPIPKLC